METLFKAASVDALRGLVKNVDFTVANPPSADEGAEATSAALVRSWQFAVSDCLAQRHLWVRTAAVRLLGQYVSRLPSQKRLKKMPVWEASLLDAPLPPPVLAEAPESPGRAIAKPLKPSPTAERDEVFECLMGGLSEDVLFADMFDSDGSDGDADDGDGAETREAAAAGGSTPRAAAGEDRGQPQVPLRCIMANLIRMIASRVPLDQRHPCEVYTGLSAAILETSKKLAAVVISRASLTPVDGEEPPWRQLGLIWSLTFIHSAVSRRMAAAVGAHPVRLAMIVSYLAELVHAVPVQILSAKAEGGQAPADAVPRTAMATAKDLMPRPNAPRGVDLPLRAGGDGIRDVPRPPEMDFEVLWPLMSTLYRIAALPAQSKSKRSLPGSGSGPALQSLDPGGDLWVQLKTAELEQQRTFLVAAAAQVLDSLEGRLRALPGLYVQILSRIREDMLARKRQRKAHLDVEKLRNPARAAQRRTERTHSRRRLQKAASLRNSHLKVLRKVQREDTKMARVRKGPAAKAGRRS